MLTVAIIIICIVNVLHLFNTLCVPETVQSPFHALPGIHGSIIWPSLKPYEDCTVIILIFIDEKTKAQRISFLIFPTDHIISGVVRIQSQEVRLQSLKWSTAYNLCGMVFRFYFGQMQNCSGVSWIVCAQCTHVCVVCMHVCTLCGDCSYSFLCEARPFQQ